MNRAILCRGTAIAGLSIAALSCAALAGEWQITPRIEMRTGVTDNVLLTEKDRKSDLFVTVSPGIAVVGTGSRIKLNLDYALNYDAYVRESSISGFRNSLLGSSTFELLRDNLFLDVNAYGGMTPSLGGFTQTSAVDRRLGGGDLSQFYSYGISPYWRTRLGSWASGEARYRFSQVFSEALGDPATPTSTARDAGTLSNSSVNDFSAFLQSGEDFNRFRWRTNAQYTDSSLIGSNENNTATIDGSSSTFRSGRVDFQPSYVVNRWLSLLGTIGYERIESGDSANDQNGVYWNTGFRLTPSERTSFELTYGKRYDGDNWASSFSTSTERGTTLTFSYQESVENQAVQAANGLGFLTRDAGGRLIDGRTGLPYTGPNPNFALSDQAFFQRSFVLSLRVPRERDTFYGSVFRTYRSSNTSASDSDNGDNQTSTGGTLGWDRRMTPLITSNASVSYIDSDTAPGTGSSNTGNGSDKTLNANVSLSYDMNETLRATLGYAFIKRDSSGTQFFSNQFVGNYYENVVYLTMRKTF